MIVKRNEMFKEIRKQMRGGEGDIEIINIISKENMKNCRLMAYVNIPVGASIGNHEHLNETEYFIILKGQGIVVDEGIEKEVKEGEVVVTGNGASHSIRNTGNETLIMIAVIITYK